MTQLVIRLLERRDALQDLAPGRGALPAGFCSHLIDAHRREEECAVAVLAFDFERAGPEMMIKRHAAA